MSNACLIAKQHGPDGMKAVYCHWDGTPTTMVPVLRRLVLDTFGGRPADALHYLFRFSGFGYWSELSGSGDAYSSSMREDEPGTGAVHKWTREAWPTDVDVYHDHPDSIDTVLTLGGGSYHDSPLVHWPQRWVYIVYPKVLALVRYVAPSELLGNDVPIGIACDALPWAKPVDSAELQRIETGADRKVDEMFARALERQRIAA